jgi:hypothetical protein
VRDVVSKTYRVNCRELANPLRWARPPAKMTRSSARKDTIRAFFEKRPRFYPDPRQRAVLEL